MKRFWLGVAILALLVGLGIFSAVGLERICAPLTAQLQQAAQAVQAGNWEQALRLSNTARRRWAQYRSISACVTHHQPMEEADALFDALSIFAQQKNTLRFAEGCARLAAVTGAMAEAQAVYWWNIL